MLRYSLDRPQAADAIENAVAKVLETHRTTDIYVLYLWISLACYHLFWIFFVIRINRQQPMQCLRSSVKGMPRKDSDPFENIKVFVNALRDVVHLNPKSISTDLVVERWMKQYGPGTVLGLKYFPNFSAAITDAYTGGYINQQRSIEKVCGADMVFLGSHMATLRQGLLVKIINFSSHLVPAAIYVKSHLLASSFQFHRYLMVFCQFLYLRFLMKNRLNQALGYFPLLE